MVPFDVPHISHDMILRFMGVNFSAIIDGSAKIPSSIGTTTKPHFLANLPTATAPTVPDTAKTPQQAKAMWEGTTFGNCAHTLQVLIEFPAYYNAGSAALVLTLIFLAIGIFVYCRRRRSPRLPVNQHGEDIPLNSAPLDDDRDDEAFRQRQRKGKGKERAMESTGPPIFDVGDDDEEYKDAE
jgi:carboxypeptidase D